MKKIALLAIVLASLFCSSCKKDYTCVCTEYKFDSITNVYYFPITKKHKNEAMKICAEKEPPSIWMQGTNCEIK